MLCAIALVLLMDISTSVSERDWILQRNQTAAAIESGEVVDAISQQGAIAVSTMLFGSRTHTAMPWRILRSADDARNAADEIRSIQRVADGSTEIGRAILEASQNLDNVPCEPDQKVIDLSTDGQSYLPHMADARDAAQLAGIRVNAIVVGSDDDAQALRENAVTYDGFLLHADSWNQYPALFRRKIILELAGATP